MSKVSFPAIPPSHACAARLQIPAPRRRLPNRFRKLAIAGLCLLQLFVANIAFAEKVYCVNTVAGVYDALNKALGSSETSSIKLEKGFYQLGQIVGTFKSPLIISGDYVAGTNCTQRGESGLTTTLDFGGGSNDVLLIQQLATPYAWIKFDRVTLQNGRSLTIETGKNEDPPFLGQGDYPGHIDLLHVHITGFTGGSEVGYGAVGLRTQNGQLTIVDALFDHLTGNASCRVYYDPSDNDYILLDHVTMDLGDNRDFCLSDGGAGDHIYEIDNSIFWASDGTLSTVNGLNNGINGDNTTITFNNSLLKSYVGYGAVASNKQVSADPKWINPAAGNYRLQLGASPAINAGTTQVPNNEPPTDIEGSTRVIGSAPDIGAFESANNDASTFTVTSASDSGANTLREAMALANASNAVQTSISFNIPGACPAVISINSALPDIAVPMQIEGYSQSGSAGNSDPAAFNATLCVVVQPGPGFFGNGFHVPAGAAGANGSLTLVGVGIGSFYRGVSLQGGYGHRILGNQFGGLINQDSYLLSGANNLPGPNGAGLFIDIDTAPASVLVGGAAPAYRNVFLDVTSSGVEASAIFVGPNTNSGTSKCQIAGNLIGIVDAGNGTAANDYGIMLEGNGCRVNDNYIGGNNDDAIWINGGNNNIVQGNILGQTPYTHQFSVDTTNGGAGVRIGGNGNVVGGGPLDFAPGTFGNLIENMSGPGIVVTAGSGNTLRGNVVTANNNGFGATAMDIDLAGDGPTTNDAGDVDTGPNLRQNYPVPHALKWSAGQPSAGQASVAATVSGTLKTEPGPGYYEIDAYYAIDCKAANQRGTAQYYIGSIALLQVPAGSDSANFTMPVTLPFYFEGSSISVTATHNSATGNSTSELSTCLNTDTIFKDGADAS